MGSAQKAESILKRMESMYENGDKEMKPTVVSYTSAINAWVLSVDSGKARKARDILLNMDRMFKEGNKDVKPNVFAFSSVINACALCYGNTEEKEEALQIAYATFKQLENSSYGEPNHVIYTTFLKACANLIPAEDKRRKIVAAIFRKCCRQGQVDANVLDQLRNAAPTDLFLTLMGGLREVDIDRIDVKELPNEWTRHVKTQYKRRGTVGSKL